MSSPTEIKTINFLTQVLHALIVCQVYLQFEFDKNYVSWVTRVTGFPQQKPVDGPPSQSSIFTTVDATADYRINWRIFIICTTSNIIFVIYSWYFMPVIFLYSSGQADWLARKHRRLRRTFQPIADIDRR